ncbi:MAG: DUF6049 family protein [Actinomycetota bacterium]
MLRHPVRVAMLGAVVLALTHPQPGRAQVPDSGVELQLVSQPLSHGTDDDLRLRLRVSNHGTTSLDGFQLTVGASSRIQTRSALHDSFGDGTDVTLSQFPLAVDKTVSPGGERIVTVDEPLSTLTVLDESGVYPLTITLYNAAVTEVLDSVTTSLIYYPTRPETRLNLVLVLPLNDAAARAPGGVFEPDAEGRWPLEKALEDDGWITGLLDAMEERAGTKVHLGVAPTPRLVEELADMADGYRKETGDEVVRVGADDASAQAAGDALERLEGVLDAKSTQRLLVPYSFPDLASLAGKLDPLVMQEQIAVGEAALAGALGDGFSGRALFAPAGRFDAATLDQLRLAKAADVTFFSQHSLEQPADPTLGGCPEASPSFTCPVMVTTSHGPTRGYESDAGLQQRFADLNRPGDDRLDLQRLFAETAMIREELPGEPGRVVQVTVPSLWHPEPRLWELLFRGFANADWLQTLTPGEGLDLGPDPVPRVVVDALAPIQSQPDDLFFDTLAAAAATVEHYKFIDPPADRLRRLERDVLVAHSRTWWSEPTPAAGQLYATQAQAEVEAELDKITLGGTSEITLTSRQGDIQFGLFNDTGYPVRLLIRIESDDLEVDPSVITRIFDQSAEQVSFEATAQSSGASPLVITVQTPDGLTIASKQITVRSTRFNQIALAITIGALLFLILFYALRGVRKRRGQPSS